MPETCRVVPWYNEALRLDVGAYQAFARSGIARLVLVDDGSKDATRAVLEEIRATAPDRVTVLALSHNGGKAEAVRRGMCQAFESGSTYIGFWDADLSTRFDALPEFIEVLEQRPRIEVVLGSRVRLLGRTIERHLSRHLAGRVFATVASLVLHLPVYDTQCGAKVFRATPRLKAALDRPFLSNWIFDVELLARLGSSADGYSPERLSLTVCELPLREWRDVAGSKVRLMDWAKAAIEMARIYATYVFRARLVPADLDPAGQDPPRGWRD